ncbi:MAG: LuxR C-terminal-related transcriptional regulator [Bacteroidales bacterium]
MDRQRVNIAVFEPSQIVYEGLSNVLMQSGKHFYLYRLNDLEELSKLSLKEKINIVILNPVSIQNRISDFIKIKGSYTDITWFGLVYSLFDTALLKKFDDYFSITDPAESIIKQLNKTFVENVSNGAQEEHLTQRETEVLVLMVKGLYNKEIADELNISIHTVISHRKNIIDKTGIKSLSGLTIYAISKKIVSLNDISL